MYIKELAKIVILLNKKIEVLSRPKAPKVLQELLSNSKELQAKQRSKDSKRFQRIHKNSKQSYF